MRHGVAMETGPGNHRSNGAGGRVLRALQYACIRGFARHAGDVRDCGEHPGPVAYRHDASTAAAGPVLGIVCRHTLAALLFVGCGDATVAAVLPFIRSGAGVGHDRGVAVRRVVGRGGHACRRHAVSARRIRHHVRGDLSGCNDHCRGMQFLLLSCRVSANPAPSRARAGCR